jgi:alkanesulfonate monooxygenase SsuD/methylene tetrahydromethanopterin reductase-like flavin-dependent oxidoreductase (luciferase family)
VRFAISIPQFYGDSEFDPGAFREYFARAEDLGYHSAWAQESPLGAGPQLSAMEVRQQAVIARDEAVRQGKPEFPVAKRVYIAIDDGASRARERVNAGLARVYGRRVPSIEAAAIAGTPDDCVAAVREVIDAGAGLVLFTPLDDPAGHSARIAAEIIPGL